MRSTPPEPEPDTICRSPASVEPATRQPSPVAPTRYESGMRTSSRNTSLKSTSPPMWRSGRTVDARRVQVDDEVGEPAALRDVRIGAGEADREVGDVRPRGPDLLAR